MRGLLLVVPLLVACAPDPVELGVGDGVLDGSVCELDKYGPALEYLYVMNRGSDSVSVVNPRSCTAFKEIDVGSRPVVANATASGGEVYVVNQGDATVSILDTEENENVGTLDVGGEPDFIRFDVPHLNLWTSARQGLISLIDVVDREVATEVTVDAGPHRIAMREDLPFQAFVTCADTDSVQVFDTDTAAPVVTVAVGPSPGELAYSSLSQHMYVCTADGLDVLATEGTAHVERSIALDTPCSSISFDPTGRWGFLLRHEGSTVSVLDAELDELVAEVEVGEGPDRIAFHDDIALVSNLRSADLSLVDLATFTEIERVPVGDPSKVQEPLRDRQLRRSLGDPDVFYLVSPYDGTLLLYDVEERAVRGTVEVGDDPGDVMIAGPIGGSCC